MSDVLQAVIALIVALPLLGIAAVLLFNAKPGLVANYVSGGIQFLIPFAGMVIVLTTLSGLVQSYGR